MNFHPQPTRSGFIFLAVTTLSGAVAIALINSLIQQPDPSNMYSLLSGLLIVVAVGGVSLYWSLVAFNLDYYLNRNGLAIQWGLGQQRIPMGKIERIIPGRDVSTPPIFRGINIAGLRIGSGKLAEYGPLTFRTTASLSQSLLVVTPNQAFVISPQQPDAFLKAWRVRRELGPTQQWTIQIRRRWPLNIALLNDPLTWWLLGSAAFLCLALFAYISARYAELPPSLPIHFNSLGHADRIADKSTLFLLPAAGAFVLTTNAIIGSLIYRREKMAAYLLWGSSVVMQLCLWAAVLIIVS